MKKTKLRYWASTGFIVLFQGVMPALTGHTELAKEGIRHLGYPEYFGTALTVFKVLGALALLLPWTPRRLKEWAYAGFTFDFVFATISLWAVDGFSGAALIPLLVLGILMVSYTSYYRLQAEGRSAERNSMPGRETAL